jgi:uncharacterized protein (DUF427 family)
MTKRIEPLAGQESVWDYPRPPRAEATHKRIRVIFNGETILDSRRAIRLLETSHPPAYYIPQDDIRMEYLTPTTRQTVCEFKGAARYWTLTVKQKSAENVAWSYPAPLPGYEAMRDHLALYPGRLDACYVDDELVQAQAGDFYGGWITSESIGPFKGGPGTQGW